VDVLFLLGKQAPKALIGWPVGSNWSRDDTAGFAEELFGSLLSELGDMRADLTERLDRIEALTEHLVGTNARAAIGYGLSSRRGGQVVGIARRSAAGDGASALGFL
jgi:hypothetical protein